MLPINGQSDAWLTWPLEPLALKPNPGLAYFVDGMRRQAIFCRRRHQPRRLPSTGPRCRAGNKLALTRFFFERESPVKEKTVQDHEGRKHPADTARAGGAAYAPHDEGAEKLARKARDDRTPARTTGEIKRAKKQKKKK
jgi:hypothetical protein